MSADPARERAVRMQEAIEELQHRVLERHPEATFQISDGQDDPAQVWIWTSVDAADPLEVVDGLSDRLLELQVGEHLPVYVIPVRAK